jgi:hypothetical protein
MWLSLIPLVLENSFWAQEFKVEAVGTKDAGNISQWRGAR